MAISHTAIKVFSRGKGQSAVAAAAYRGGLLLSDFATGQQHDYRRRNSVVETFCLAPPDAPDWALVPGELWAVAEAQSAVRTPQWLASLSCRCHTS